MIQFAVSKGLNVRSTTFPHKYIHKETWYSADSRTANVLISNRFRSTITYVRALRGPDIGSDHNLLKITFKVKLRVKTKNKYTEKRKIVNIFQNSKWVQEYAMEINNRFEILENMEDEDNSDNSTNEKWESIKAIIKDTKKQLTEKDESTGIFQNRRFDEECKIAIKEMKKPREKWQQNGRGENEEQEYVHKRKEAHNIIRNKKKLYIKNVIESIEEGQKDNNKENVSNNKQI